MTLKDAREAKGWSQIGLDAKAGLPKGTVHDIEAGRNTNPTWAVVSSIVRTFKENGMDGVSAEKLFPHQEARQ